MKNNKGISLITLTVMIIVMIILASIAYSSSFETIEETGDTKVAVEKEKIKEAVSKRMVENAKNPAAYPLIGDKVDDIVAYASCIESMSNGDLQRFTESINDESIEYMRVIDCNDAANLGVGSVSEDHYFIVDYYSGKVYGIINMDAYNNAN